MRRVSTKIITPPSTLRETFELFRFYREETGLEGILRDLELEGVSPRQLYYAVHNRPPDSLEAATADSRFSIEQLLAGALRSGEFRQNAVRRLLAAFPEKKRLIFVHVPKCAGSNLSAHLIGRFPSLHTRIQEEDWASEHEFFLALKHLVLESNLSDAIYIHGHNHLATYADWGAIRLNDEVFTTIRDPIQLVISQINYVLTRIFSQEFPIAPDTIGWRNEFNVPDISITNDKTQLIGLSRQILHHVGVVPPNVICHFLGGGSCEGAIEQTVIHNLEVTDLSHYDAWCRDHWGLQASTRTNESVKFITAADLSEDDHDYIQSIVSEDLRYYHAVSAQLNRSDKPSLIGKDILSSQIISSDFPDQPINELLGTSATPAQNVKDLVLQFESLGENCEFGLVQRKAGAEPLGLLRFASAPYPKLVSALAARFKGMGQSDTIKVQISQTGREYMILDKQFEILYHAWVPVGEKGVDEIYQRECKRLPLLIQKLLEDLEEGRKIFVYHSSTPLTEEEATSLAHSIGAYGPGQLLWVELADADHPPGSVERLSPRLMKGYMDRFAPQENAHDFSTECWIEICAQAYQLVTGEQRRVA